MCEYWILIIIIKYGKIRRRRRTRTDTNRLRRSRKSWKAAESNVVLITDKLLVEHSARYGVYRGLMHAACAINNVHSSMVAVRFVAMIIFIFRIIQRGRLKQKIEKRRRENDDQKRQKDEENEHRALAYEWLLFIYLVKMRGRSERRENRTFFRWIGAHSRLWFLERPHFALVWFCLRLCWCPIEMYLGFSQPHSSC